MKLNIDKALKEVQEKSEADIERETSIKWAERAAACFHLGNKASDEETEEYWMERGEDFSHEAVEHAALVMDFGETVKEIQTAIEMYKIGVDK